MRVLLISAYHFEISIGLASPYRSHDVVVLEQLLTPSDLDALELCSYRHRDNFRKIALSSHKLSSRRKHHFGPLSQRVFEIAGHYISLNFGVFNRIFRNRFIMTRNKIAVKKKMNCIARISKTELLSLKRRTGA